MDKSHHTNDDSNEAGQQGQDHEGPGGVPVRNTVCVSHALSRHTVSPQTLVHVIAGVPVLHPVVCCRGDDQEDVADSSAEQPTAHEAVHPHSVIQNKHVFRGWFLVKLMPNSDTFTWLIQIVTLKIK